MSHEAAPGGVIVPNNANHALAHAIIDIAEARANQPADVHRAEAEARRDWAERERDWAVLAARALKEVETAFPSTTTPRARPGARLAPS